VQNNVLMTSGSIDFNEKKYGKIIEINRATNKVLFEATIIAPQTFFIITFHSALRMPLFNQN